MFDEKTHETYVPTAVNVWRCGEQFELPAESVEPTKPVRRRAYRLKMGREPIWLRAIEFQILAFLSAHPYRAYTRRQIAEAVSNERSPLSEGAVDQYIASLRDQLGFFRNYIQSVPYIGYRFRE